MCHSMSQVDSLSEIQVHKFVGTNHPELWDMVDNYKKTHHEGKKIKPHIYYCSRCNTVIIMPPWFTSYFMPDGINYSGIHFLQNNIECCNDPIILILLRGKDLNLAQKDIGMTFVPYKPDTVMIVPDRWTTTTIVAEELLSEST